MSRYFFLFFFFLISLVVRPQITPNSPKRELRAVWLTTLNGLDWPSVKATGRESAKKQRQQLCDILDKLAAANFNAVVMQMRIRGTVVYPSAIEPWDACLTGRYGGDPGYDPLAFAVEECHKRGMQLHAWVVAIPGNKLAQSKALGQKAMERRVPQLCLKTNESYMLNPGLPETADYLASICEEIVRNYDVDGISLDYIRYPEKEVRFNDAATYSRYAAKGQSVDSWRRDNISRCVKTVHDRVKALKPWVAISCSPVGKYNDTKRYPSGGWNAYRAVCQDAKLWLKEGWMDILMPMMYFRGNHFYPFLIDWQDDANGRCIAAGLGVYLIDRNQKDWPRSVMENEIEFCRAKGAGGQVFFRSRFVTDNPKGIYTLLKNNLYRLRALPPALTGDNVPTPVRPESGEISYGASDTKLSWSPVEGCTYIVYRSNNYPVDIENSANIYQTNVTDTSFLLSMPVPSALMPYYAVTAINRYGVESEPLELNKPRPTVPIDDYLLKSAK
ncbi:MAG: glycoside hydrolase family 10 protein [Bacteroidaceae bacterium]